MSPRSWFDPRKAWVGDENEVVRVCAFSRECNGARERGGQMASSAIPVHRTRRRRSGTLLESARIDIRYPMSIGIFALFALGVSAWGGLAPFIGPEFGYTGAGGGSFQWTYPRALLSVLPAAVGIVGALLVLGASGSWRLREGRASMRLGGLLSLLAGAWFALGWAAWGPIHGATYLADGTALRRFSYVVGIAVGPGVLVVAFGALVFGFLACAARWRSDADMPPASSTYTGGEQLVESRPVSDVVVRIPDDTAQISRDTE
jgi:hypothetical protein